MANIDFNWGHRKTYIPFCTTEIIQLKDAYEHENSLILGFAVSNPVLGDFSVSSSNFFLARVRGGSARQRRAAYENFVIFWRNLCFERKFFSPKIFLPKNQCVNILLREGYQVPNYNKSEQFFKSSPIISKMLKKLLSDIIH